MTLKKVKDKKNQEKKQKQILANALKRTTYKTKEDLFTFTDEMKNKNIPFNRVLQNPTKLQK